MATIASLLRERVTLQVRSVDRLFLQAYVPKRARLKERGPGPCDAGELLVRSDP